MRGRGAALVAGLAMVPGLLEPGASAAAPERIVSLNLCLDQLLIELVDPERIASVSFVAADPNFSAKAEAAARFPLNHGLAEEILPLEPDLVLAGAMSGQPTAQLLDRLGHEVVELPLAVGLDDIAAHVRRVAEAVGAVARGEELIEAFEAELDRLAPPPEAPRPLAAVYVANGYTHGPGTLVHALVEAAGLDNLAARLGLDGIASLPLETLLMSDPDLLVIGASPERAPALAQEILAHPALEEAFAAKARTHVPEPLWTCGIPVVTEAVAILAEARAALLAGADG